MSEAIQHLRAKGNFIFDSEAEAVKAAILMHDIGHGPFSHVLENTIVQGISHEEISLMLMERINREVGGQLTLAIQIFKDEYPVPKSSMEILTLWYFIRFINSINRLDSTSSTVSVNSISM